MKPSVARSCTYRSISAATSSGVPTNVWLAVRRMIRSRMLRFSAAATSRSFAMRARTAACRFAKPCARLGPGVGLDVGERAVGVVAAEVAVPDLLEVGDRRLGPHLRERDLARALLRLFERVAEHERRGGQDLERLLVAPVRGEAALDVAVELLRVRRTRCAARRSRRRARCAKSRPSAESPACTMTGRPCGERGTSNSASIVEQAAVVPHARGHAARRGRRRSRHPPRSRRPATMPTARFAELGELGRARVPVGVVEVAAAAEVRAVEGVGARHGVPAGAAAREVVERAELAGEFVRLVERRARACRRARCAR